MGEDHGAGALIDVRSARSTAPGASLIKASTPLAARRRAWSRSLSGPDGNQCSPRAPPATKCHRRRQAQLGMHCDTSPSMRRPKPCAGPVAASAPTSRPAGPGESWDRRLTTPGVEAREQHELASLRDFADDLCDSPHELARTAAVVLDFDVELGSRARCPVQNLAQARRVLTGSHVDLCEPWLSTCSMARRSAPCVTRSD